MLRCLFGFQQGHIAQRFQLRLNLIGIADGHQRQIVMDALRQSSRERR